MLIRIDSSSERALFDQIADSIRREIVEGRIAPGQTLGSARDIAVGLDVNQHTVLRAYQALRDEGLIDLRRGRGAVVTAQASAIAQVYQEIELLLASARERGVSAATVAALVADAAALTADAAAKAAVGREKADPPPETTGESQNKSASKARRAEA